MRAIGKPNRPTRLILPGTAPEVFEVARLAVKLGAAVDATFVDVDVAFIDADESVRLDAPELFV